MNFQTVHLDSFSGRIADLPKGNRDKINALLALSKSGRVSTWDMETLWIRSVIQDLERERLIVEKEAWYPWYIYKLTDAGMKAIGR